MPDLKALAILALALAVTLFAVLFVPRSRSTGGTQWVVEVVDNAFDPPGLLLQPGDELTWVWSQTALTPHTVTAYHPLNGKPLRLPPGVLPWDSGARREAGTRFTVRFDREGVYDYFCLPHEAVGMVGRVVVQGSERTVAFSGRPLAQGVERSFPALAALQGTVGQLYNFKAQLNALALFYRLGQSEEAQGAWTRLWQALERSSPLRAALDGAGVTEPVQRGLQALRQALAAAVAVEAVTAQVAGLKDQLAPAISHEQAAE